MFLLLKPTGLIQDKVLFDLLNGAHSHLSQVDVFTIPCPASLLISLTPSPVIPVTGDPSQQGKCDQEFAALMEEARKLSQAAAERTNTHSLLVTLSMGSTEGLQHPPAFPTARAN